MKKLKDTQLQIKPGDTNSIQENNVSNGLWEWNIETDEVFCSQRWKTKLGYPDEGFETLSNTWSKRVHPDDYKRLLAELQAYLSGDDESLESEIRLLRNDGREITTLLRTFRINNDSGDTPVRLLGFFTDISHRRRTGTFMKHNSDILEMIAIGKPAIEIYAAIALMYESRNPGIRCSMLELDDSTLLHGGAPSLPEAYCQAVHGLKIGPNVGSCGTSTFTGQRCLVENIETDPKWANLKRHALPHGMRCCWSEPIKNSSGKVLGAFGMYHDYPALPNEAELADLISAAQLTSIVMERDHAQKFIRRLAYTDSLTGLSNRHHFSSELKKQITSPSQFLLLYIDLDDFKSINDSLGHDVGDQLLKEISARLKHASQGVDLVARTGGDEFCIIARNLNDDMDAEAIARRYLKAINQPIELSARKLIPTCSIGIVHYPKDGIVASLLLKAADAALFEAKVGGKNQYAVYKPEFTEKVKRRFEIDLAIREAIENRHLTLVYQPQIAADTREIIGYEALCRWHHPELGNIPPVEFIATAERIGMIKPLTEWVLATACKQAVAWKQAGGAAVSMAVNISSISFLDWDIVTLLKKVIAETGIVPAELELEITESAVQTAPENLLIFKALRELGVQLAIDDFGTGFSSIASLKHLHIDRLKIDRYFLSDMLINERAKLLVESIISMGLNLGHEVIAEGVETEEQLTLLKKMGCELAQGYLFGKPISPEHITSLLGLTACKHTDN